MFGSHTHTYPVKYRDFTDFELSWKCFAKFRKFRGLVEELLSTNLDFVGWYDFFVAYNLKPVMGLHNTDSNLFIS